MTEALAGQLSIFDLGLWSGKTSPEHCQVERRKERTSESSLKKQRKSQIRMPLYLNLRQENGKKQDASSWQMGGALLGAYMTHSFGESPRDAVVSRLSQILQDNPRQKYCLSAKACQGILNRANRRGKELPKELRQALERQAEGDQEAPMEAENYTLKVRGGVK